MLSLIEARTRQGILLSLPLRDVSSGIVVTDVDGLGPVKATIVSSGFAQMDGTEPQSAQRESRNIKFQFSMEPQYGGGTVRQIRRRLYAHFMPKSWVKLRFYLEDGLIVDTEGQVETCEPAIFTKEPSVDVSLICFDPDLIAVESSIHSGTSTSTTTGTYVEYDGDVDSGFILRLFVDRAISSWTMYYRPPNDIDRSFIFVAPLQAGDLLEISTGQGEKYAKLVRSGIESSILYGVSPQSTWPFLGHGDNLIRIQLEGAPVPYEIRYTNKYGGL